MEGKWLIYVAIISGLIGVGVIIGSAFTFLQQIWTQWQDRKDEKWKQKQLRINTFLEKRWKTYSEGLTFIYDAEENQHNAEGLKAVQKKWSKWHPSNCLYLPDSVRDALNEAMKFIPAITVELGRPDGERHRGTLEEFKRKLQEVKTALTNLKEVGWLPPELE